jgi:hypothetical protein
VGGATRTLRRSYSPRRPRPATTAGSKRCCPGARSECLEWSAAYSAWGYRPASATFLGGNAQKQTAQSAWPMPARRNEDRGDLVGAPSGRCGGPRRFDAGSATPSSPRPRGKGQPAARKAAGATGARPCARTWNTLGGHVGGQVGQGQGESQQMPWPRALRQVAAAAAAAAQSKENCACFGAGSGAAARWVLRGRTDFSVPAGSRPRSCRKTVTGFAPAVQSGGAQKQGNNVIFIAKNPMRCSMRRACGCPRAIAYRLRSSWDAYSRYTPHADMPARARFVTVGVLRGARPVACAGGGALVRERRARRVSWRESETLFVTTCEAALLACRLYKTQIVGTYPRRRAVWRLP